MSPTVTPPLAVRRDAGGKVQGGEDALHARETIRVVPSLLAGRAHPELAVEVPVPALRRLRLREGRPAGHGQFRVLTEDAGDERFAWDAGDFAQIAEAKRFFNQMLARGMVPYRVGERGAKTNEVMTEFDPLAEEVVFLPTSVPRAVVGG